MMTEGVTRHRRKQGKKGDGVTRRDGGFVDENYHWIEGRKRDSTGHMTWWPLYCFPRNHLTYAQGVLSHIKRERRRGFPLKDGLDQFDSFRLHGAGEWRESIESMWEVRGPGTHALAQALRKAANLCHNVLDTGEVCVRPKDHRGRCKPNNGSLNQRVVI